ncbi:MAG: hypothetical protein ACRD2W_18085 [Acidimicrobiales bacterium]
MRPLRAGATLLAGSRHFADGTQLGYLRQPDGDYVTLDPPGGAESKALGINNRCRIVGEVKDAGGRIRGFLHGLARWWWTYRLVDGPGNPGESMAIDINDRGDILIPAPGSIEHLVDLVA